MTPTISPELQDKIQQEAIAKYPGIDNNIKGPANCHKYRKAFIAGATSYAHYKERWEQAKKALEEILKQDGNIYLLPEQVNDRINVLLAIWKEEGKEGDHEG